MAGEIVPFDFEDKDSQRKSREVLQADPWNIVLGVNVTHQFVRLLQNNGKNEIRFPSPEVMRTIAGFLNDYAGRWERGELPGLKVPEGSEFCTCDHAGLDQARIAAILGADATCMKCSKPIKPAERPQ